MEKVIKSFKDNRVVISAFEILYGLGHSIKYFGFNNGSFWTTGFVGILFVLLGIVTLLPSKD